mgnify:CR=1 FL=1
MALSSVLLNNKKAIVLAIVAFLLVIVIFSKLSPSGKTEHKQEFQDRFDWRTMPGVVTSIKNQGKPFTPRMDVDSSFLETNRLIINA